MTTYTLMTPARNEEAFIEKTLQAVVAQTALPQRWIIVNDGSTDRTAEIVSQYAAAHPFIHLVTTSGDEQRNFGSKSKALHYAYSQLEGVDFNYIGNLDADISFDPHYYENILHKMAQNPNLGLAGGVRHDLINGKFKRIPCASNSVGGPIQLFRRDCYEEIGGYMVLPHGGIDAVAEMTARMCGWDVRSFPEYPVYHYRSTGRAKHSLWSVLFHAGIRDYTIGYNLLFECIRAVKRFRNRPYIIGPFIFLSGYLWAMLNRFERPISPKLISFLQQEQLGRLKLRL